MLYGVCVKEEAMFVDEGLFVDELSSEEKGGCTRDPL
jgi:hypothetical protein